MKLTENESIFCQALAMTSLLAELNNNDFLNSDYYNSLKFQGNEENFRKILKSSGLGNPATMQMYLYILLVMPKELLKMSDTRTLGVFKKEINQLFIKGIDNVITTYKNEDKNDITTIDFYNHTRNSVAHSNCRYKNVDNKCYVEFYDVNPHDITQHCEIFIETSKVGKIIEKLIVLLMDYLNKKWSDR